YNEQLPREFCVRVFLTDVDRLDRPDLVAHAAEDAAEVVDLVDDRVPVPLVVLPGHEPDAVRRTDRRAEAAGHALRAPIRVHLHALRAPPPLGQLPLLVRVLHRDLSRVDEVPERESHAPQRGTQVRGRASGRLLALTPI